MYVINMMFYFFFYKQKTAYKMRISDWSSDVCSSDLGTAGSGGAAAAIAPCGVGRGNRAAGRVVLPRAGVSSTRCQPAPAGQPEGEWRWLRRPDRNGTPGMRSEEHTSELQSLMRISYAVFCLKKKKTHTKTSKRQN